MARNSTLKGTYSMLTQGFNQAGMKISPATKAFVDVPLGGVAFPGREAPVIASFLPSEQYAFAAGMTPADVDAVLKAGIALKVHGGYRPVAALGILDFDGKGGFNSGFTIAMLDGTPQFLPSADPLPAMTELPLDLKKSCYQVDPGAKTARARLVFQVHVLIYFLTILKDADELHFLVIGATSPVIQSGVMKRTNP